MLTLSVARGSWSDVFQHVEARRLELGWTKTQLYDEADISEPTYSGIKRGTPIKRADKRASLCDALRWRRDSLDLILEGGEPVVTDQPPADELRQLRAEVESQARALEALLRTVKLLVSEAIERHENGEPWRQTLDELGDFLGGS